MDSRHSRSVPRVDASGRKQTFAPMGDEDRVEAADCGHSPGTPTSISGALLASLHKLAVLGNRILEIMVGAIQLRVYMG